MTPSDPIAEAAQAALNAIIIGDHREKVRQLDRLSRILGLMFAELCECPCDRTVH